MKYTLTLILLFLGCAYTPLVELEEQSYACGLEKSPECNLIYEELEKRYKYIERRQQRDRDREKCPPRTKCYYGDQATAILNKRRM